MTIAISPEVKAVLENASIDGNLLKLGDKISDRKLYLEVDKVLVGLGGKWNRGKGGHVFGVSPEEALANVLDTGTYGNRQKTLQHYDTPEDLAERMAVMAGIRPGARVLEPNGGLGRLVLPLLKRGAIVDAVEIDPQNFRALQALSGDFTAICADFLEWGASRLRTHGATYDVVVMNPPFSHDQACHHIRLAWDLLKPGGRLVAICDGGVMYRPRGQAPKFRDWLISIDAENEELPAGTFRASGTDYITRLISATKAPASRS